MLKSDRQFGIELEFIAPNKASHMNIAARLPIVFDGSLRPHQFGSEWVSPILSGKSGERAVMEACSILKKYRADVDNPKTSFHVHLDGKRNEGVIESSKKPFENTKFQVAVSKAVASSLSESDIIGVLLNGIYPYHKVPNVQQIKDVLYLSKGRILRPPRMNYTYYKFEKDDRAPWLRNVFYFYTKYNDVLQAMVSKSRKVNNMYCIPLSDSFDLEEIEGCKTERDIIDVWYKGRGIGGHYDDSRYHNVNLHSYFDRHGTVEIRSHGATLDPYKILLWVRLHQHIVDKLETVSLDDIKSDKDPFISFIEFLDGDELLIEYCKRLWGYFGGVIIKGNEVIIKTK